MRTGEAGRAGRGGSSLGLGDGRWEDGGRSVAVGCGGFSIVGIRGGAGSGGGVNAAWGFRLNHDAPDRIAEKVDGGATSSAG